MAVRKIIHIDMDAFYASVEQRDNPEWKGKPIAVGGAGKRGVVAAASYEARNYGVRSAMPSVTASRLCPELIFVKPRFKVYRDVSLLIRGIFERYTDLVEPLSLDEAYLDVTTNKRNISSATQIAMEIRQLIREETGLTASAGISYNKFLAKIASDVNKPDGMKVITPKEALPFLEKLAVNKFHGIGKVTAKKMHRMKIFTGADLKKYTELELIQHFGKVGSFYFKIVRGKDPRDVNPNRVRKSVSAERTFPEDLDTLRTIRQQIARIAEMVFVQMKKNEQYGRTLTLKIKTPDFRIITRSKTFQNEICDLADIKKIADRLLLENKHDFNQVRLIGFGVSNLSNEENAGVQLEFDY